jgi:hypothetical protein
MMKTPAAKLDFREIPITSQTGRMKFSWEYFDKTRFSGMLYTGNDSGDET